MNFNVTRKESGVVEAALDHYLDVLYDSVVDMEEEEYQSEVEPKLETIKDLLQRLREAQL